MQRGDLARRQRSTRPVGAEPGGVQDLVAVDVADAGDDVLVEQQRLQLPRPAEHAAPSARPRLSPSVIGSTPSRCQLGHLDGDVGRVEHDDLAERARVDEPQLLGRARREAQRPRGCAAGAASPAWRAAPGRSSAGGSSRRRRSRARSSRYLPRRSRAGDRRAGQPVDQRLRATCAGRCARGRPRPARCAGRRAARRGRDGPSRPRGARAPHCSALERRQRTPCLLGAPPARRPSSTAPCPPRATRPSTMHGRRRTSWRGRGRSR